MFRREFGRMTVVFQHPREFQMGAAETEIHGGQVRCPHKLRQIVAGTQPSQDAVALPAPGNYLLPRVVRIKMPTMFQGIFFNAFVKTVIIPTEGQQHAFLFSVHGGVHQLP